jgi:hypothetical protein
VRRIAVVAVAGALAVLVAFGLNRGQPRADPRATTPPAPAGELARAPEPPPPPRLERDPFQFADGPPGGETRSPAVETPFPAEVAPRPEPAPIRLVGFVRRDGRVSAALWVRGEVRIGGAGDDLGGFLLLAVDEDAGVRVRQPDGSELTLQPPA